MRVLTFLKRKFLSAAEWAEEKWVSLVVMMVVVLMFWLLIVIMSWVAGFWLNGLMGMKFDLSSCWAGIGAIGTGMFSVAGLAFTAWSKYYTDSRFNSEVGKCPNTMNKIKDFIK